MAKRHQFWQQKITSIEQFNVGLDCSGLIWTCDDSADKSRREIHNLISALFHFLQTFWQKHILAKRAKILAEKANLSMLEAAPDQRKPKAGCIVFPIESVECEVIFWQKTIFGE